MSYAINTDGLAFPPIPAEYDAGWSMNVMNTFNTWAVDVSNILANITGIEDVNCLSEISCCAGSLTGGTIGGWTIDGNTQLCSGNMILNGASGFNFNNLFCVDCDGGIVACSGEVAGWVIDGSLQFCSGNMVLNGADGINFNNLFCVDCDGGIVACSGTVAGWNVSGTEFCIGAMSISSANGINFNDLFCVDTSGGITSNSGNIAGWGITATAISSTNMCIDNANELISVGNPAGVHLQLDGGNKRIRTSDFASGAMGTGWQVATDITEFQNIRARGVFTTAVFECQSVSAIGGSFLVRDADVLDADMTALDASCLCLKGDATFAIGDFLRIKHGTDDEWFEVTCVTGNAYCVDRDKGASYSADANPIWPAGTAVINYGVSGEGGIYMTSSENCSPYINIFTHAGSPWSTLTNQVRLGNLDGITSTHFPAMTGYGLWAEGAYIEGSIVACDIKLLDPACADNFSCLDAGALKFHDVLGDVPYLKRVCSGNEVSGTTIILNGWCAAPEIQVSVNSMKTYDCVQAAVSQTWSAYADTPAWYCSSATCYGYCFDIHATLTTDGTKCSACAQAAAFDACVVTYDNVINSKVGFKFQLWCNAAGVDQCYSYGSLCYEVCYRCCGCGAWEGSCSYTYCQAHDSSINLQSDCIIYHDVALSPCECWELMATQTGLSWVATAIPAGGACAGSCTRAFSGVYCCLQHYCFDDCYCYLSAGISLGLAGSNPANITCNVLHYNWCTAGSGEGDAWFFCIGNYGGAQRWTCWESYIKADSTTAVSKTACFQVENDNCIKCCSWSANTSVDLGHTNDVTNAFLCMCLKTCIENTYGWAWSTNEMCVVGGCLVQCFNQCCASAAACSYMCLHTTCDTTATCCVLDATGQVNWLAISYS